MGGDEVKVCEGAPWCLMLVPDGTRACKMHQKYPAQFNEGKDRWMSRVKKAMTAQKKAEAAQAASDAKLKARK